MKVDLKIFDFVRSEKILACKITEFLNQIYQREELMNQPDFWQADINSITLTSANQFLNS